mmetsp:Transcript_41981/g.130630  ORF Transcript_41981/g.130630 Transcript_41981/m.130630 type:complete len:174 (-) Transcript_41981:394-915(-)
MSPGAQVPRGRPARGTEALAVHAHSHASGDDHGVSGCSVWHLRRCTDGRTERTEEFLLALSFAGRPEATAAGVSVTGCLAPCTGASVAGKAAPLELDGQLTKVALRLEHRDPDGGELCVYRSERFLAEGDGHFRGVWMCGQKNRPLLGSEMELARGDAETAEVGMPKEGRCRD